MKSIQQILKANGQDPNITFQSGKLEFNNKAGCLVYCPPGINKTEKEIKSIQIKISETNKFNTDYEIYTFCRNIQKTPPEAS